MSPTSLRPERLLQFRHFLEVLLKMFINYTMYREFGEQDQQAPIVEEMKGFGQIQAQSLLDHEMAEMSPVEKMPYLQSHMHFDESMESIADTDLEDGELQTLLTSPLVQERAASAQTSHPSGDH